MTVTAVTSKGRVTIPKQVRQQLGFGQGSRIGLKLVGDHVGLRVHTTPVYEVASGFGMLKSHRSSVPADFDPASVLKR